jgi:hypothetical protein
MYLHNFYKIIYLICLLSFGFVLQGCPPIIEKPDSLEQTKRPFKPTKRFEKQHALVVGINQYQHFLGRNKELKGAVNNVLQPTLNNKI